jgi:putative transposase
MLFQRGYVYRLQLKAPQEVLLRQAIGVCRLVYNIALEQRRDFYRAFRRATGSGIGYVSQARELTNLRREFPWIAAVSQTAQQQALRDLDKAYQNFFAGRAKYPSPRKRGVNDAIRFQGRECETRAINRRWAQVKLPKIGWVTFRATRALPGTIKNVTVSCHAGAWHVAFCCAFEREVPMHEGDAVGVDLGVASTVTLSTGEIHLLPIERINVLLRRRKRLQRAVARGSRGSNRNRAVKLKVARIAARIARIRRYWQHETSNTLAERFSVVAVEDLRIRNMTASSKGSVEEPGRNVRQKAGLNRSILERGWADLIRLTAYKVEERGGLVVRVDPKGTSQTCSVCNHRDPESRKSQAGFQCVACGYQANADINAARNIFRRWNTPLLDVDGSCAMHPIEASTKKIAA